MKVSLNTIKGLNKRYGCADDVTAIGVDKLIEKVGAQLGAVEEVVKLGERYRGIVIVKVVDCTPLEGSDHLSVCRVDDGGAVKSVNRGEDGLVQVVCGAPNVQAGQTVAWLPPGTTVPESVGREPFVLETREIRGQKSNGMLASPKELALGDSHKGILVIEKDIKPGTDFAEAFELKDDVVLDIENKMFTHRPDLFGFVGVARELAGIQNMPFKSPDWYTRNPEVPAKEAAELPLEIRNEIPALVPRFSAIVLSGVQVGPSPAWLQVELAKVGLHSINNIVDYTNFFMLETGQPLHAYDYDKVKEYSVGKPVIVVRNPHSGEKLRLLNGKEVEPRAEAILIATDKQAIGLGGVMGGAETEVGGDTGNIILECANFDMYSIRRTSMEHGLFTDAVTRFTKGQSPLQNLAVLMKIADEIRRFAGGKVASGLLDDNHLEEGDIERGNLYPPVKVNARYVNERLGLELDAGAMKTLLENVEFTVDADGDELSVHAPFWRTDIELREDVVEEIGRLYGYDHLPLTLPKRDLTPAVKDPLLQAKAKARDILSRTGANEVLTYSFVHGDLLEKAGQNPEQAFRLSNALSPDLQYYRLSLMPSLLASVHPNIKAGYDEFALFEIGKVHTRERKTDDGLPAEDEYTALVVAAKVRSGQGAAYYEAYRYLTALVGVPLKLEPISADKQTFAVMQPYLAGRAAMVSVQESGKFLGIIGEFKPSVTRGFKLPDYCAGFELDTTVLQEVLNTRAPYVALPRYPKVAQDISLKIPAELMYQELYDSVSGELARVRPENSLLSLTPVDIYQGEDNKTKNITLRLEIASYERTLTDKEVNAWLDEAASAAKRKFGAERL